MMGSYQAVNKIGLREDIGWLPARLKRMCLMKHNTKEAAIALSSLQSSGTSLDGKQQYS